MQYIVLDMEWNQAWPGSYAAKRVPEKFRGEVGRGLADTVLASLINRSAWDGRIDKRVAEWAAAIPEAWDEEAAVKLGLYTSRIHMAHLNQIGNAARKAG